MRIQAMREVCRDACRPSRSEQRVALDVTVRLGAVVVSVGAAAERCQSTWP